MKKIIVIGGTGTIGSAVVKLLSPDNEVLSVGLTSGDFHVDMSVPTSILMLFEKLGDFDALVCAAGDTRFGPLDELDEDDLEYSATHKLLGQANLVRIGSHFVKTGGSFTLTSGIAAEHPVRGSAAISMVNAGVEGFARAAALELTGQARVNVVSPASVSESLKARGLDPANGIPVARVAKSYQAAVTGEMTGAVLKAVP